MTEKHETKKKLDSYTQMAIMQYERALRAEKRAEHARKEVDAMTRGVPAEDLEEYVRITTEMEDNMEKWGTPRPPKPKAGA
jgi:hypothetical protein